MNDTQNIDALRKKLAAEVEELKAQVEQVSQQSLQSMTDDMNNTLVQAHNSNAMGIAEAIEQSNTAETVGSHALEEANAAANVAIRGAQESAHDAEHDLTVKLVSATDVTRI